MLRSVHFLIGVAVLPAAMSYPSRSLAVVTSLSANVTSEVRERVGDAVINSDLAFDELDITTRNLPLVAEARLFPGGPVDSAGLDEGSAAAAAVTTVFRDPRLKVSEPPDEFSVQAIGLSAQGPSSVEGFSRAVESREVVFRPEEVNLTAGTSVIARSHFFIRGVMALLAESEEMGLAGSEVRLSLRVTQQRAVGESVTVFEAAIELSGQSDGTAKVVASGGLSPAAITPFGPMAGEGAFQAVNLPELALAYTYPADIGETFTLRAEVEARFIAPPGRGAMLMLGTPQEAWGEVLTRALGEGLASGFEVALSAGVAGLPPSAPSVVAAERDTIIEVVGENQEFMLPASGLCGLLGIESAMLAAAWVVAGMTGGWLGGRLKD